VSDLFQDLMNKGVIKPLKTTVFKANEIQEAFRFFASGKSIGKIVIEIRDEKNDSKPSPVVLQNSFHCDMNLSYIVVGGLGGFGLELGDWFVLRGCKKLVLSSSRGITSGYQAHRIK